MPVFKSHTAVELARGIKAFLNLEAGVTRGKAGGSRDSAAHNGFHASTDGIRPENVAWIFGTARVGSTWLGAMMDDIKGQAVWHEPLVGELFGYLYYVRGKHRRDKDFILGGESKSYISSIRAFVMSEANAKFPQLGSEGYLVIKEPNGSIGAPLLCEALPESRMILLVRDPRDVISSALDANREGGWFAQNKKSGGKQKASPADANPNAFVREKANKYMQYVGNSKQAYDAHRGPKVMVRYEELVENTLSEMKRIYSTLGMKVDEGELERVVEKHSWENIPAEKKGDGKFYRKGSPGSWKEDLTPEQVKIVERLTNPLLEHFYPNKIPR